MSSTAEKMSNTKREKGDKMRGKRVHMFKCRRHERKLRHPPLNIHPNDYPMHESEVEDGKAW